MKKPSPTQVAVATAFVSWLISFYLHHPNVEGAIYSDVTSFWWREPTLQQGMIPCIQYFFEYPSTACLIVYTARLLGGETILGYYVAFSVLSLPAFLAFSMVLTRLNGWAGSFFVLMPSMILYGIYNFDHFFTALMSVSLLAYLAGKKRVAYVLLGAAFSVKLFTVLLLPLYLAESKDKRQLVHFILLFLAGALPTAAPIVLLNPSWVPSFLQYHISWGLENAWTVWISNDPFSQSAKAIGYLVALILLLRAYTLSHSIQAKGFLVLGGFLLGSPIFTPQMAIWLLPFIASIKRLWIWVPLFESSNAAIILTWFTTETPTLPWTPPQTMALLRAAALAAMWITVYRAQTILGLKTARVNQA